MKRISLACDDPGKFFLDCKECEHYEKCDYFQKVERRKETKNPLEIRKNTTFLDINTGKIYKPRKED